MEEWRTLLYPLGFLSSFAFGGRFIIQWLESERKHQTVVPRSFWILSLLGNILLAVHSFIQVQYHICIVQSCNAVISWRNLNLMQPEDKRISLKSIVFLLVMAAFLTTVAFIIQDNLLQRDGNWFRRPTAPWQIESTSDISFFWHALGTFAYLLFSSRFWIQWILSEKSKISELPLSFWWISLIGAFFSILYFIHLGDTVNLIGPLVGIVPYLRNLMIYKPLMKTPKAGS